MPSTRLIALKLMLPMSYSSTVSALIAGGLPRNGLPRNGVSVGGDPLEKRPPSRHKPHAAVLVRDGVDYAQSKAVFRAARARAGLRAPPERRGGVGRLTVKEELHFLEQAYAQGAGLGTVKLRGALTLRRLGPPRARFVRANLKTFAFCNVNRICLLIKPHGKAMPS